jgi:hypothetical protein
LPLGEPVVVDVVSHGPGIPGPTDSYAASGL